jgi:Zn-finger protein
MSELSRNDVGEETVYVWDCPNCNFTHGEEMDDPVHVDEYYCSNCDETITLTD